MYDFALPPRINGDDACFSVSQKRSYLLSTLKTRKICHFREEDGPLLETSQAIFLYLQSGLYSFYSYSVHKHRIDAHLYTIPSELYSRSFGQIASAEPLQELSMQHDLPQSGSLNKSAVGSFNRSLAV